MEFCEDCDHYCCRRVPAEHRIVWRAPRLFIFDDELREEFEWVVSHLCDYHYKLHEILMERGVDGLLALSDEDLDELKG